MVASNLGAAAAGEASRLWGAWAIEHLLELQQWAAPPLLWPAPPPMQALPCLLLYSFHVTP
jgi:hypothetical protein